MKRLVQAQSCKSRFHRTWPSMKERGWPRPFEADAGILCPSQSSLWTKYWRISILVGNP